MGPPFQVLIQLPHCKNELKLHSVPSWGVGKYSTRQGRNCRRPDRRSHAKSFQGVLAEPLGSSKEDGSSDRDALNQSLLRPTLPTAGFEPRVKRKVAMHVAYVGTSFRGTSTTTDFISDIV